MLLEKGNVAPGGTELSGTGARATKFCRRWATLYSVECWNLNIHCLITSYELSLQNQVVWFRVSGIPHIVTVFRFLWKREFPQVSDLTWHPDFTWGRDFRLRILAKLGPNPVSDSSREFCFTRLSSSRNTLEIIR